jgi:hypothetical protein
MNVKNAQNPGAIVWARAVMQQSSEIVLPLVSQGNIRDFFNGNKRNVGSVQNRFQKKEKDIILMYTTCLRLITKIYNIFMWDK